MGGKQPGSVRSRCHHGCVRIQRLAVLAVGSLAVLGCGDSDEAHPTVSETPASAPANHSGPDPGPVHIHGLGINPSDGALFMATHTGLFRLGEGDKEAVRVADRYQDTMGFTVVGPDRFLGSGHPDGMTDPDLPPFLGLIESQDAGESWEPVSLLGEADFHVLEAQGNRVYGFGYDWETREPQFLVSSDGAESWDTRDFPEELISVALHPGDVETLVASSEAATYLSTDAGSSWRELDGGGGLVAWPSSREMLIIDPEGSVQSSANGTEWQEVGHVGGEPAAFESEREGLFVALHDGSVKQSSDGGESWEVRYKP